jgi:hypothetical protein
MGQSGSLLSRPRPLSRAILFGTQQERAQSHSTFAFSLFEPSATSGSQLALHACPPPLRAVSAHSVRRVFPITVGNTALDPAPFRSRSRLRLTQGLRFFRTWHCVQVSRTTAAPTGPWLSTVYHARACNRYYGLMRQSDELRPAWAFRLTLAGLCPHGPLVSPSRLCFVTLFMHAATSTPSADRVLLMAHPSIMRAFTVPITFRLFRDTLLTGFGAGSTFGAAVFS